MRTLLSILFITLSFCISAQDAYWRFENNANDDMGNYNLTAVSSPGYSTTRIEGTHSADLDLSMGNRYETTTNLVHGDGGLTITFAFQNWNGSGNRIIYTTGYSTGNRFEIYADCANKAIVVLTNNGSVTATASSANSSWTAGDWVTGSVRLYSTSGTYCGIFVNGSKSGTDSTIQSGWTTNAIVALGANRLGSNETTFYGRVDNVSVYTCALTNAQIAALHTNIASDYEVSCSSAPGTSYSPIHGRHVRFYANGIEKRDKPRSPSGSFFYWKLPGGTILPPSGNGDYYFSSINGNDANDGLSAATPKQTLSALNALLSSLLPGDTVLIERGSYYNNVSLNFTRSGTTSEPVVFGCYGSGALPILSGADVMTSFVPAGGNLWYIDDTRILNNLTRQYDAWTGSYQEYDLRTGGIGWIAINGTYSGMSQYPDGDPLSFEVVDLKTPEETVNRFRWVTDNSNPFPSTDLANGYTQGKLMQGQWSNVFTTLTYSNASTLSLTESDFMSMFGPFVPGLKGKVLNSTHATVSNLNGEYTIIPSLQRLYVYYNGDLNAQTVEVPVNDYVISITNASNIVIQDLDIRNGRLFDINIHGGMFNALKRCIISRCPGNAVNIAGSVLSSVQESDISYADNGIGVSYGSGIIMQGNYIHHIGLDAMLGDKNGASSNGIYLRDNVGDNYMEANVFYMLGYCGVHSHDDKEDYQSAGVHIKYNLAREWCLKQTDGGAHYLVGNNDDAGSEVIGNICIRSDSISPWVNSNSNPIINSIYIDDNNSYVDVDSNSVWGVGMFNHFGNNYNRYRHNKILVNNYNNYANDGFHSEAAGPTSINVTFSNNEVVSTSNSTRLYKHIGTISKTDFSECSTWTIDNNKYFSYNSGQNFFAFSNAWDSWQYFTTLAAWRTFTGKEANSELKFNSTMSTTEAVMYVNYSGSSHTFDLGTATFRDYDNNVVTGTVIVPKYRSVILYKTGGSLDGDSNIYIDLP